MHQNLQGSRKKPASVINYKDIKRLFTTADSQLPIDNTRKSETLQLLCKESAFHENRPLQDRRLLLLHLLHYADWNLPGLHLLSCIALPLLLLLVNFWEIKEETILLLSMLLPGLLACLSAFEVRQICFTRIAELSETCFFHVRQLAALSMLLSGVLNLAAVTLGILLLRWQWEQQLFTVGLYILVPFVFMQCICFGTMLTEAGRRYVWLNAVLAIPLALCCTSLVQNRMLYTQSALFVWTAALIIGIILLLAEIRLFFSKLGKGDILCTDWN